MRYVLTLTILIGLLAGNAAFGATVATEQAKQEAIDKGLAWLAANTVPEGSDRLYWRYNSSDGNLAATASATLAFIEEGYLPYDGSIYGETVGKACEYMFSRVSEKQITQQTYGHPEDYDNNGTGDGNGIGLYFNPGNSARNVYTTGLAVPVVSALGDALGKDTVINMGNSYVYDRTYAEVMRDLVDWYSWGQVEGSSPTDTDRGGWRYDANYSTSDNSTAQWGGLTMLYGQQWGIDTPDFVKSELERWCEHIQNDTPGDWRFGGSGYSVDTQYVNMAKTAGLLLELKAIGADISDSRVQNALAFMESVVVFDHWNQSAGLHSGQWYGGHMGNPYAMWGVYKALEVWNVDTISTAPGGFQIGQNWWDPPVYSSSGDWYSHYCAWLVDDQNLDGSWPGYSPYWTGALANGWYINILNAAGVPGPDDPVVPEPLTLAGVFLALAGAGGYLRRRRTD